MDFEYRDHNTQKNRIIQTVCKKTDHIYFSLHLEKVEKEAQFWERNINMHCLPHTGLKIRWNFATICSCLRDLLIYRDIHNKKSMTLQV